MRSRGHWQYFVQMAHVGEVAEVGNADFSDSGHGCFPSVVGVMARANHVRAGSGVPGSMPYRAIASVTVAAGIVPSCASEASAATAT